MTLEEQLRHAFDSLAAHLRDEVTRHAGRAIDELASTAETERAEAVADAARDAWSAAEREGETRLASSVAETAARVRISAGAHATAGRIRLLDAIRSMDNAQSLSDILDVLVTSAAAEMSRATLLLTENSELRSWRSMGFGVENDERAALASTLADGGIATEAAETGEVVRVPGASVPAPVFAALSPDRCAAAVPLQMNGRVLAVLYADEGPGTAHDPRSAQHPMEAEDFTGSGPGAAPAAILEILARHATRCLESVTSSRLAQVDVGA